MKRNIRDGQLGGEAYFELESSFSFPRFLYSRVSAFWSQLLEKIFSDLPKNVGKFVGHDRWTVAASIINPCHMVTLLSASIYLALAHIEDGEGLTVDDFRFDDLDFHFLSFSFLSLISYIDILASTL